MGSCLLKLQNQQLVTNYLRTHELSKKSYLPMDDLLATRLSFWIDPGALVRQSIDDVVQWSCQAVPDKKIEPG